MANVIYDFGDASWSLRPFIGLGAGVLAAYGRAGDVYRFYEINPLVADIARREFSFLADSAADTRIVLGDAPSLH